MTKKRGYNLLGRQENIHIEITGNAAAKIALAIRKNKFNENSKSIRLKQTDDKIIATEI